MSAESLASIVQPHIDLSNAINLATNGHGFSSMQEYKLDLEKDVVYEGYFMRAFTSFESTLEDVFIHFSCGGASLSGNKASCRLANCTKDDVRNILKQNGSWIDWANVDAVRERASLFFLDGKPFKDTLISKSDELTQMAKIRNRIAHNSYEAKLKYESILVPLLSTKPIFGLDPGYLLRSKRRQKPFVSLNSHYIGMTVDVINAICEKPATT